MVITKTDQPRRAVIPSPQAFKSLSQGFEYLADLLALTLGPNQGVIVNARNGVTDPEFLVDSGTIARRVVQLPDRAEDAGAQILRTMVMEIHDKYGDGATTASVLASAMILKAGRLIAAGLNPMSIRNGIERGVKVALQVLMERAQPVSGQEMLANLALGVTGDEALAKILGEMFDILGQNAGLIFEEFYSPFLEREYLDGGRWTARPAARSFMPDGKNEVALENPLIVIADWELEKISQVQHMLELASQATPKRPLLLVARDIKSDALTTLLLNLSHGQLNISAIIPAANLFAMEIELEDIALMSGARNLTQAANLPVERMDPADFGQARRAVYTRETLAILGGAGNPEALQSKIAEIHLQMKGAERGSTDWDKLRLRAARLAGGVGILKIGAYTERERLLRIELAKKASRMLDLALADGILPGGGVAYLECQAAVQQEMTACSNEEEQRGIEVIVDALEAPFKQIVKNYGRIGPAIALEDIRRLGPGHGLDVRSGDYAHMTKTGILDCVTVLRGALQAAASAAVMAITTDVIVLT